MITLRVILALVLVNIFFGIGYPFVKTIFRYLEPSTWVYIRVFLSTIILIFVIVFSRSGVSRYLFSLKKIGWLLLASVLGIMINQLCFVEGLYRTIPAHASIINATIPLQTLLYARFFIKEKLTVMKLGGIAVGMVGVLYLLGFDKLGQFNPFLKGDGLVFINSIAYSLFLVIARKNLSDIPPVLALAVLSFFGVFGLGYYAGWDIPVERILNFPTKIWIFMAYIIIFSGVLTYVLNLWALKRVESSYAALFVYFQPLVATTLSYFMLGDIPGTRFYVSGVLIFAGILLGSVRR